VLWARCTFLHIIACFTIIIIIIYNKIIIYIIYLTQLNILNSLITCIFEAKQQKIRTSICLERRYRMHVRLDARDLMLRHTGYHAENPTDEYAQTTPGEGTKTG
jgi:hypothetical protein